MSHTGFLSSLNIGTLLIGFLIVAAVLAYFLRRRSNRHSMDGVRERNVAKDLDAGKEAPHRLPPS